VQQLAIIKAEAYSSQTSSTKSALLRHWCADRRRIGIYPSQKFKLMHYRSLPGIPKNRRGW
jgi:hypothetical protein